MIFNFWSSIWKYKQIKAMDFSDLKPISLNKIKTVNFPENQYLKEEFTKTQIVGHHTVGASAMSSINTWLSNADRVGTCIVIDRDGTPYQIFSSKYWAYHLKAGNSNLDRHSIGVEIANWGWLTLGNGSIQPVNTVTPHILTKKGKYYNYYGKVVDCEIQYYDKGFRGHQNYEKYTTEQIRTFGELLLLWNKRYNIPLNYNEDMWDVSPKALSGTPGVWTHDSYRPASEKTDLHPQPELINMLKQLKSLI